MSCGCEEPAPRPAPCGGCKGGAAKHPESALERRLREASEPLPIEGSENITVNGVSGIHANASETQSWRSRDGKGVADYQFFNDSNPEVIRKKFNAPLKYQQEVEVKFLRPPTLPEQPPIRIVREGNTAGEPAPPVVIRQPGRPAGERPAVVLRERPPQPPAPACPKTVRIPGKQIPPPPRRVVVEKLPDMPCKPGKITIERWLGYERQRRQVILERGEDACPAEAPRNLLIEWESPAAEVEKVYRCLGTQEADPVAYLRQYSDFADASQLNDIGTCRPDGVLAVDAPNSALPELYGDVQALSEIDLEANGLGEYRSQI